MVTENNPNVQPRPGLGELVPVHARDVWPNEARDFTPWLAENQKQLSAVLGLEIELDGTEHPVGQFFLDIIGRDLTNDCPLIIENQLEATDHSHLGQLITYAAGTDAKTVIWIATEFREPHRQAIDFLNDIAGENARFFGVEIRAVKIGDSSPAPLFQFAAKPNNWHAIVAGGAREAMSPSGTQLLYRDFWQQFLDTLHARHPGWTNARSPLTQNWLTLQYHAGSKINFLAAFGRGELVRFEVYIDTGDAERNLEIFKGLMSDRENIESELGSPLTWEELPESRACRIFASTAGQITDVTRYNDFIEYFISMYGLFRESITRRINTLSAQ